MNDSNLSSFIWTVADLLRGDYRQPEYGKVILPFTVLCRLVCVLEGTKPAVLAELEKRKKAGSTPPAPFLTRKAGQLFYNTSPLDMKKLMGNPTAGTGSMLSIAGEHLAEMNPDARLVMYGQQLNAESSDDVRMEGNDTDPIAEVVNARSVRANRTSTPSG